MFGFLTPRYLKEGKAVLKHGRKLLAYKRDLLKPEGVSDLEAQLEKLAAAVSRRDRARIAAETQGLEALVGKLIPTPSHPGWRENTEVFLVAIVIALGVRTYFLQPFTIPTGSMQPTLNGIIAVATNEPRPNPIKRMFDYVWFGRNYLDVVSETDDTVLSLIERKRLRFFTFTEIKCERRSYTVQATAEALVRTFKVDLGRKYAAGEVIARGHITAGDHVFVDKMSYNFERPERGEVFVFKTTGIRGIESRLDPAMGSQFYIKRLVGLPGDELRIDPPKIFVNGKEADTAGSQRVMSQQNGYRGYGLGPQGGYLSSPERTFELGPAKYFALGDNSYNSSDSRYWGTVPERNIMGRGFFVYWPFGSHWGLIR